VVGSISTPVIADLAAIVSGIIARNSPEPQPGSSTLPPLKPSRARADQIARTMNSGV